MKTKSWAIAFLAVCMLSHLPSYAQNYYVQNETGVSLDVTLAQALTEAQIISASGLGVNTSNGSSESLLAQLILQNTTSEPISDLFFRIYIGGAVAGPITELIQREPGFTLAANQYIVASNNQLQNGIPGISTRIRISTGDTDNTEEFINSLNGSTTLPDDVYTVTVQIRKGSSYGDLVAEVSKSLGAQPKQANVDLFLLQPGDDIGSDEKITSEFPIFRWDGPNSLRYRLLVVEAQGQQSPEALLQGALASEPAKSDYRAATGSLLEYEKADVEVRGTSFTFPPNGLGKLTPGSKYYWQVYVQLGSASGTIEIPSTIWEFSITDLQNATSAEQVNTVFEQLQDVIGADLVQTLQSGGFRLVRMEKDGSPISGQQSITMEVASLIEALQNGTITVVKN